MSRPELWFLRVLLWLFTEVRPTPLLRREALASQLVQLDGFMAVALHTGHIDHDTGYILKAVETRWRA